MSLLTVRNMSKRFGGLTAVDDVSLSINKGEIYGLIGPNGAGKTTCFNLITGLYPADSGEFSIADKPYFPKQIEKVTAAGIARTFQNVRLFNEMSVLENVMVGRHVRTRNGLWAALSRHKRARAEETETRELAWHWLEYTGIASSPTIAPAIWPTATSVGWRLPARWQPIRCCWRWTNRPPG
jgi:branched-chain amino acid transport system ATP-binding protein